MKRNSSIRGHLKYLLWLPVYLTVYLILERRPVLTYRYTQLPIDDTIPFREGFVLFYCLWYFWLTGTGLYLLSRCRPAFRRYMTFLALTFLTGALIWFLIPNAQSLRPTVMPRENLFTAAIALLYRVDTCTNVFPSGHVIGSVGTALAWWDCSNSRAVRLGAAVLAALICASTVLIKQHALLDVAGGLALSLAAALPVYCRAPVRFRFRKTA